MTLLTAEKASLAGAKTGLITSNAQSTIAKHTDFYLQINAQAKTVNATCPSTRGIADVVDDTIDYSAFVLADCHNQAPHRKLPIAQMNLTACPDAHRWSKTPSNSLEVAANGLPIDTVSSQRRLHASSFRCARFLQGH